MVGDCCEVSRRAKHVSGEHERRFVVSFAPRKRADDTSWSVNARDDQQSSNCFFGGIV